MNKHVNKPSLLQLPKNHGVTTGYYTVEEAQDWIDEHREAMLEVSRKDTSRD